MRFIFNPAKIYIILILTGLINLSDISKFQTNLTIIGFEPFYAVETKAYGNFSLQRAVDGAAGLWTTVQTISPGSAGSVKNTFHFMCS